MTNRLLMIAVALISFAALAAGQGKPPKPSPTPTPSPTPAPPPTGTFNVRTTIHGPTPFYSIQSDGLGAYVPFKQGKNVVESQIQGIGDWELNTRTSTTRKAFISFGDPVVPGDESAPFTSATLPMRFISKCSQFGIRMHDIPIGGSVECPLALGFPVGNTDYAVRMQPDNYPGTEMVRWTCTGGLNGVCNAWEMTPSVQDPNTGEWKVIGQLIRLTPSETLLGKFYISFRISLSVP